MLSRVATGALAGLLVVAVAGCGEGGQGGQDTVAPSTTVAESETAAPDAALRGCESVGEELESEADETVTVGLDEYAFDPSAIEVEAGVVTFAETNGGEEEHELAFLPGEGNVPLTAEGEPDEEALEAAGAFELEAFGPGQTCNATYALDPGTYTLFCIVAAPDGETHLTKGMRGQLVIR